MTMIMRQISLWAMAMAAMVGVFVPEMAVAALPVMRDAPLEVKKPRIIVLSDIGNEPDDSQSLVRLLLYANELDIEGLIASTSVWQRDRVQPHLMEERVRAYGQVLPNLRRHAGGFPDAAQLASTIRDGVTAYGMAGVGEGKDTEASRLIVAGADRADARPLWILVWGGAADLAQALWHVRATRSPAELDAFVGKLRVYSISDQDDAGPWLRRTFPQLFWIASIHGWNDYSMAAWNGISGDILRPQKWPYADMVSDGWRAEHIEKGLLGTLYPKRAFIMEGDTPSFLYLIPNGLGVAEHPEYGSWGGRYGKSDLSAGHYGDVADAVQFPDGSYFRSNQATVFRWRDAFQRDFAARIAWTLSSRFKDANHAPVLRVNGVGGIRPVPISGRPGDRIVLDAAGSSDPDGDDIRYRWWHYTEPSGLFRLAPRPITGETTAQASFILPKVTEPTIFHIILEATDVASMPLTRYRRVLVEIKP